MTHSEDLIASFSRDEGLGAGNFLFKLCEKAPNVDEPVLTLDLPVDLPLVGYAQALSLRQLAEVSTCLAASYRRSGVESKDPIGLWFDDTIDYLVHYLALTRIGAIPVFVNGGLDREIAVDFMTHVKCRKVMSRGERAEEFSSVAARLGGGLTVVDVALQSWPEGETVRPFVHTPYDPVLIGHSSGTTGRPKAVQFLHEGFAYGVKRELAKQVGSRVLTALPHSHASAISILMTCLLRGAAIRLQSGKDPERLLRAIEEFRPDLVCAFPKVFVDLCRVEPEPEALASVGYWLSTGDANHEAHIRRLMRYGQRERHGQKLAGSVFIDNLGSSEFGFAAFRNLHIPERQEQKYERRIGKPFAWVVAEVLDDDGNPLPPFAVGKLGVKSPTVTAGYWNDSLLTEKNRLAGYWLTGDLVYRTDEGIFYHVDRIGDSFATKSGTIHSCQLEEFVLRSFPEVFECSVVGVKQESGPALAVMTVELTEGAEPETLLDRINDALTAAGRAVIDRLLFEAAAVDTGVTGKKLKRVLRDRFRASDTRLELRDA
jgi:acyl-coenzyme A synthetase/AMP-(fatty) acid ligase